MTSLAIEAAQSVALLMILLCLLWRRRSTDKVSSAKPAPVAPPHDGPAKVDMPVQSPDNPIGDMLEIAAGAIISVDGKGRILLFSRGAEYIFGYRAAEMIGQPLDLLIPERHREAHRRHMKTFATAVDNGRTMSIPDGPVGLRKDGTEFPAEAWICKFSSANKAVFTVLLRDISERKRTENALRQKEQQLRLVTDHVPAMVLYVDRDWRYHYVNKTGEAWYNRPASAIIGNSLDEVLGEAAANKIKSHFAGDWVGETNSFDEVITYPDGVTRDVAVSWVPHIDADGAEHGFFAIIQDMTEQRRLQDRLSRSQKMDAIGELSGGIAHDYNNLLMVIDGYARRAMQKLDDQEIAEKSLQEVVKATERAARLTKQMLAFSRRQIMEKRVFGATETLLELKNLLEGSLEQHHELRLDLDDGDACIETDAGEFDQAVVHLVLNARDAMPDGGVVTVKSRVIEHDQKSADDYLELRFGRYLELTVTDQGEGIAPDVLPRVFDPFFTTKEQGKGTGLGLSMVYGFAQQSGGIADIRSVPGKGTTVQVLLPVAERAPVATCAPAEIVGKPGNETILLVEDDELLLALVRSTLEELGYTVLMATNGCEAVEVSEEYRRPIDLLLSDIVMPVMGGLEAAELIREARPDIKVIFMTGHPNRGRLTDARLPSGAHVLQKPLQMEQMAHMVRSMLDDRAVNRLAG